MTTTTVHELAAEARQFARTLKESQRDETPHVLLGLRDGHPVVVAHHSDVQALLAASGAVASGFALDALGLVLEGVVPLSDTNPRTGRAWAPGEAEHAWEDHDGVAEGSVSEVQVLTLVTRDGERAGTGQAFRTGEGSVEWSPQRWEHQSAGAEDVLRRALSLEPTEAVDGDRLLTDVAFARVVDADLAQQGGGGGVALVLPDEETAARATEQGLQEWQTVVYGPRAR